MAYRNIVKNVFWSALWEKCSSLQRRGDFSWQNLSWKKPFPFLSDWFLTTIRSFFNLAKIRRFFSPKNDELKKSKKNSFLKNFSKLSSFLLEQRRKNEFLSDPYSDFRIILVQFEHLRRIFSSITIILNLGLSKNTYFSDISNLQSTYAIMY